MFFQRWQYIEEVFLIWQLLIHIVVSGILGIYAWRLLIGKRLAEESRLLSLRAEAYEALETESVEK